MLTRGWSEAARTAFAAIYDRHRGNGLGHEVALMLALAEVLP